VDSVIDRIRRVAGIYDAVMHTSFANYAQTTARRCKAS
jgi:hypothetical protein